MRLRRGTTLLMGVTLVTAMTAAQTSTDPQELPSAPSAVKIKPVPQPAPPAQSQPAAPAVPAQAPAANGTAGQNPIPNILEENDPTAIIRHTVNEVDVLFTVTDRGGHYIKDMQRADFKVLDDSQPSEIRNFNRETNLPLQVGLLVDASNSIRDRFKFEQDSAIEFLNQTVRPRYDQAFVVGFDATPEVTQDFTDNTELLSHGVRSLTPGGGTAMYDALYFACRDKLLKTKPGGLVRRAIVLLSDGEDNQSHVTREEAIEMAQRADVIVYTISTNLTGSQDRGDKVLSRIADATGGRAFFPYQLTDIATGFMQIQEELRSQYVLSYSPAEIHADGRYHTIEILAKNRKGLRVRSRRGYYAPSR